MDKVLGEIFDGIVEGKMSLVRSKVDEALEAGCDPSLILDEGMIAAMGAVGHRFERGEYFVPEMLLSARVMKNGLAILKPHLQRSNVQAVGKVVMGTVQGDLHDIGKNLVGMMLEGAGFEICDLGTDVTPAEFVDAVSTVGADIVAMSALLTTTMQNMHLVIQSLEQAGVRDKVNVMVGGAPLSEGYAREIGADGFAENASRAVALAKALMAERQRDYLAL